MQEFGIIGKTLAHSFSKKYFEEKFKQENISDCIFNEYSLNNIEEITELIKNKPNLKGFSVTIPYKEAIISYLDDMDDIVKEIGACNSVKVDNGKLIGYNTDVTGFLESFMSMYEVQYFNAIILGNGGASKAVKYALEQLSIDSLIVARNPKNNDEISWNNLTPEHFKEANIVINTTPLGTFPNINEYPDIPYSEFSEHFLAFDLIYNPEETIFLKNAREQRSKTINGYYMLEIQAEKSWEIWNHNI